MASKRGLCQGFTLCKPRAVRNSHDKRCSWGQAGPAGVMGAVDLVEVLFLFGLLARDLLCPV